MTAIALVNGSKYWAGASRPFYISQGTVSSYLRGKGFSNVVWHERSEALPATVTPRSDPTYDDDWDEWVSADYNGPAGSISPPTSIPWLIVHLPSVAQTATTTAKPSTTTVSVPSWVTSSIQAGQAAAAAGAAAAAAAAGVANPSAVSSGQAVPAQSTPTPSAPRDGQKANAGAAVLVTGVLVVLGTFVAAILRRKRH